MKEVFELEKKIWTESDFEIMSWHDCHIHAISFNKDFNVLFDIDYIFKWVKTDNGKKFNFWISPCTWVFENVYGITLESNDTSLIIDNVSRQNPRKAKNAAYLDKPTEYNWLIETTVGGIEFKSVGFKQYVRQTPVLTSQQELDIETRKGISFDQSSFI